VTAPSTGVRPPSPDRWVLRPALKPEAALRLICVPYAGGSAAVFHGWGESLPPLIEQWTLRLPGRDTRMNEPPATDLAELAEDAAAVLAGLIGDEPFAFFGHSLGAFVAFETLRVLRDRWGLEASLLAVSARAAPQLPSYAGRIHRLPDEEFLTVLDQRYRAIPPMVREDPQMRAIYLPILRADTMMLETYAYWAARPLDCPVLAYGGTEDTECGVEPLAAWGELTSAGCTTTLLPGGHFFLQGQRERLLDHLGRNLVRTLVP
jgi:medium-chain acyl-[acyl-carrier-protein] hydrolase